MVDVNKLVRENVKKLIPYSCARDEFKGKSGIFMDANENPYGKLNRYPDPYQAELKAAISKFKEIAEEKIFLGNGSDEIIDLCFRIFCKPGCDKALTFTPTYGMYEVSASVNDIKVLKVPLNENFQIDLQNVKPLFSDKNLKLIFICSPNNPTGNSMNYSDVENILSSFNGIVVIDEAYIDFSEKPSFIRLVDKYSNLVLMQTFSKAFGLAAVRVGMAFSNPVIIQYFNKLKPPYNISTINQKAALRKLNILEKYKSQVRKIRRERERLSSALLKMKITEKVYPSDSNFLLVKVKDANEIYNTLVNKNIIVRNRSSFIYNCLRITIGKKSENNKLVKALKTISI
ncbi:MAG: histidinol-phosphate transaminase [Bacteroidetes bacterium]|nr:MAG: histidinol-phosphate transaminase [Bacteroidota bacterium]